MRILHLGKYYPPAPGGIEAHVRTLARAQADLGHQVSVLCVQHADSRGRAVVGRRLAVTRSSTDADGAVDVRRLGRVAHLARLDITPGLRGELARRMKTTDIVHLHTPNPLMLLACASLSFGPDLVITHHSDAVRQRRLSLVLAPFENRVYSRARVIFSTSAAYISGSEGLQRFHEKTIPLPLGIDLDPYLNPSPQVLRLAETIGRSHPGPLWLMVGRLVYYKGHAIALEALARVSGTLLVVGTGPLVSELRKTAARLGVADRVRWLGHQNDEFVAAAYRAAMALWFPSVARSEGFGLAQVEAMASGCPVINTAIPASGVPWVSPNEVSGLTVPVGDAGALAAAAARIAGHADLRERLAHGARARALAEFGHRQMALRWEQAVGA